MTLAARIGFVLFLLSSAVLFGQIDSQSSYSGQAINQPYGQRAEYNQGASSARADIWSHGPMQAPAPNSLGLAADDPNNLTPLRLMQILRQNPELISDIKQIVIARLRQEGRTPPGGRLTQNFVMDEIQNDAGLRAQIVQDLQMRGALPPGSTTQAPMGAGSSSTFFTPSQGLPGAMGATNSPTIPGAVPQGSLPMLAPSQLQPVPMQAAQPMNPTQTQPSPMQPSQPQPSPLQSSQFQLPQMAPGTQPLPAGNQPQLLTQPSPYGDLQSLRDLYTQVPDDTSMLSRFGMDVFLSGSGNTDLLPVDLPADGDYILGSGDALNIHIWGAIEQDLSETVDHTGRVELPSTPSLMVAGKTLPQAQEAIRQALSAQFKNTRVEISLARVRTVRVYVVGDVQRPGAYDVSSLSTPLNALLAAGGPTDQGSLRTVKHYRGSRLVATVDLYDLLLNGVSKQLSRLESGDTLLVSPVGPQVTIAGMVRRPAIYEITEGDSLARAVELAGGLQVSATVDRIEIDRVEAYKRHVTMTLQIPQGAGGSTIKNLLASFQVQDGDRIQVSSILPNREETVYVDGHVFRPGKRAYAKGMQLSDVIHSYQDLMPEPADRAAIIRLVPPDFHPTVIDFKLSELLSGEDPIELQPFDTVRIYGRYDLDPPTVTINGEVELPGQYPLGEKMTVGDLVRMAGGFKRSASMGHADLSSYVVKNGQRIITEHKEIKLSAMADEKSSSDVRLKPGDVVTIRQLAGWEDIGDSVTLDGEVMHPGTYGIETGEKLSDLLERAGGFRETAFPEGTDLERIQVRQLATKSQEELIARIESEGMGTSFAATSGLPDSQAGKDQEALMETMMAQQKNVISELKSHQPSGRLVINISGDISQWKGTAADIELRDGDEIAVPKRSDLVMVNGQVYNPSALSYVPGKTAEWYLRSAGGFTELANKKAMFVVRANGAVVTGKGSGGHNSNVLNARIKPGDIIIAPEKIVGGSQKWRNLLGAAQLASTSALTAGVASRF